MKFAILDAGPIISLTLNGLTHTITKLKEKFPNITFIITPQVKKETIEKGMTVKKYELEAVKIQDLINRGVINMSSDFIKNATLAKETERVLSLANKVVKANGEFIQIVQVGEASCLAFSRLCNAENLIIIDERVTRLLTESPDNLKKIMERKLHTSVNLNSSILKDFREFRYIRSTELAYIAYKNNLLEYSKNLQLLDAVLYSLKFAGTSISSKEIEEIKNLSG